jgi:hypothetical protein
MSRCRPWRCSLFGERLAILGARQGRRAGTIPARRTVPKSRFAPMWWRSTLGSDRARAQLDT